MTDDTLPPLPEAWVECDAKVREEWAHQVLFTADQMRDYARAAIAAEREACVQVCLAELAGAHITGHMEDFAYNTAVEECAAAIRARGEKE